MADTATETTVSASETDVTLETETPTVTVTAAEEPTPTVTPTVTAKVTETKPTESKPTVTATHVKEDIKVEPTVHKVSTKTTPSKDKYSRDKYTSDYDTIPTSYSASSSYKPYSYLDDDLYSARSDLGHRSIYESAGAYGSVSETINHHPMLLRNRPESTMPKTASQRSREVCREGYMLGFSAPRLRALYDVQYSTLCVPTFK